MRVQLLRLLWTVAERPASEYPAGRTLDEAVVEQLGRFREVRAVEGLRRVLSFRPDACSFGSFERDRRRTLGFALESLAMILGDGAIADVQDYVGYGLPAADPNEDFCAPLRYFAVRALAHCSRDKSRPLLERFATDPDRETAEAARALLGPESGSGEAVDAAE